MTMPFHRIAIYLLDRIVLRFLSSTSCAAKSYANGSAGLNAINKCNHPFIHLPFGENTKKIIVVEWFERQQFSPLLYSTLF